MKIPSKGLLKAVAGIKHIDDIYIEDNLLYFCILNKGINIYELAHKCKEWALREYKYSIQTVNILDEEEVYWPVGVIRYTEEAEYRMFHSTDNATEIEAIFAACEWILENERVTK